MMLTKRKKINNFTGDRVPFVVRSRALFSVFIYLLVFSALLLQSSIVFARQEFFPFLAEITANKINVRAGQNTNYEKLFQMNKGDKVIVLGKEYSWYKIELPPNVNSYISADLVKLITNEKAEVTGGRVNVRARANTNSTVMGKVVKGDVVYIKGMEDDWYRIEPIDKSYGWISDKFIVFRSRNIDAYKPKVISLKQKEQIELLRVKKDEEKRRKIALEEKERAKKARIVSVVGRLEEVDDDTPLSYRVLVNDKPIYYLEGFDHLLDRFVNYDVDINGKINKTLDGKFSLPVLNISKIKLIL